MQWNEDSEILCCMVVTESDNQQKIKKTIADTETFYRKSKNKKKDRTGNDTNGNFNNAYCVIYNSQISIMQSDCHCKGQNFFFKIVKEIPNKCAGITIEKILSRMTVMKAIEMLVLASGVS